MSGGGRVRKDEGKRGTCLFLRQRNVPGSLFELTALKGGILLAWDNSKLVKYLLHEGVHLDQLG